MLPNVFLVCGVFIVGSNVGRDSFATIIPANDDLTKYWGKDADRRGKEDFSLRWMKYVIFPSVQARVALLWQKVAREPTCFSL